MPCLLLLDDVGCVQNEHKPDALKRPYFLFSLCNAYLYRESPKNALSPACAACARMFNERIRTRNASRV